MVMATVFWLLWTGFTVTQLSLSIVAQFSIFDLRTRSARQQEKKDDPKPATSNNNNHHDNGDDETVILMNGAVDEQRDAQLTTDTVQQQQQKRMGKRRKEEPLKLCIARTLSGSDPGLLENLNSFTLECQSRCKAHCEIVHLFCVTQGDQWASGQVAELIRGKGTHQQSEEAPLLSETFELLTCRSVGDGNNDKMFKMRSAVTHVVARCDWIVFVDSNVRAPAGFLGELQRAIGRAREDSQNRVFTTLPVGVDASNFASRVEACIMNTLFARETLLASVLGLCPLVGKIVAFPLRFFDELPDVLLAGSNVVCEDAFLRVHMRQHPEWRRAATMLRMPAYQHMGIGSWRRLFSRYHRWFVIHHSMAPLPAAFEWFLMPAMLGVYGATAFAMTFSPRWWWGFYLAHMLLYFVMDLAFVSAGDRTTGLELLWPWLAKELLLPLIYVAAVFRNTVTWRGRTMTIKRGGVIET